LSEYYSSVWSYNNRTYLNIKKTHLIVSQYDEVFNRGAEGSEVELFWGRFANVEKTLYLKILINF
jgi:hypothetical protein